MTDTTTTDADAELRAQLDSERTLRETAERKLKRVLRAELTDRLLREANVSPEAAAAWRDEMIAAKTEKRMRKLVEARAAERQAILREAARDMPVEGVPFRAPAHASNPDADSGLLSRLGLDANDYAPAGA